MSFKLNPRMARVYGLAEPGRFTLNLGSGETSIGDVTADINRASRPSVVLDATRLPFRGASFDQVIFADVIEHIPEGKEVGALAEIRRVLRAGGRLVLSTPFDRPLYTWTDPARFFSGHRHYKVSQLERFNREAGLKTEQVFTAGGIFACIDNLFVMGTGASKRVGRGFLTRRVEREYEGSRAKGYTIFMVSTK
ncbi:MAG TPA: class I SAM-dependent methyltransferase [Nitrososphaerales archaeon]|nr:class I SAM-dependent methyltransferase [Nitrososphaerales archaeon]HUK74602.1 class I SAM-dependent methyltransferase [Nitrososphaerales archaeon]